MKPTEIQRAVLQCKEQSNEMLERACIVVENSVKNDNLFEVLFAIAKRWEELFIEELNSFNLANNQTTVHPMTSALAASIDAPFNYTPPPILEMVNGQNQINNANLEAYIREQQQQQQQQQQQGSNANNFFNAANNLGLHFNRMNFNPNQMFPQQGQQANQMLQNMNLINPNSVGLNLPFINNPLIIQQQQQQQQLNFVQQQFQKQQPQNLSNNHNSNISNFPFNLSIQQLNFYQNNIRMQQQQQQNLNQSMHAPATVAYSPTKMASKEPQNMPASPTTAENSQPPIKHLKTAFRVAMLGLEALPKRVDGTNQSVKYRQNPIYFEDVKWLWEIAIKLDAYVKSASSLQQFCHTAACVIQNPFVLQKLAFDTANFMSGNNLSQFKAILCSPLLNILVQRCMNLWVYILKAVF